MIPLFYLRCLLVIFSLPSWAEAPSDGAEQGPVSKWTPQIRVIDSEDYSRLPCDQLATASAETPQQQRQLHKRKQQCLQQYRAFTPNNGVR